MTDTLIQIQVLYEIATAIGNSLDLNQALKQGLSTYLRKLNCAAGVVLAGTVRPDGSQRLDPIYSIPRRLDTAPICRAVLRSLPGWMNPAEWEQFVASLPMHEADGRDRHYHVLELPGFGALILVKSGDRLDTQILQSLKTINRKLAGACIACLQNERLARANAELRHEIDQRVEAEKALQVSHATLATVLESIDADVYVADLETYEILFMNEHMRRSFGGDLVGQICWRAFRGASERCQHCTNELLLDGDGAPTGVHVWDCENPITGRQYLNCDRAIRWHDGRYVRLQAAFDTTELRRAERALRASEARYRDLFDNVSDLVYAHDLQGRLQETNLARKKGDYGLTEADLAGLTWHNLLAPGDLGFDEYMRRILSAGRAEGHLRIRRPDGEERILEYRNSVVCADDGAPRGVRGSARDITERIRAEDEKRVLEERLRHAQRLEALGTLAAGIAHNFNNILMGIMGHASLGQLEIDPAHPAYARFAGIERMVQNGAKLAKELLGYARKGQYQVKPGDLNEVVRNTARTFSQTRKEIVVRLDLASDLHAIQADRSQIEQMLLNLYVNAADAMPGGGTLSLVTRDLTHDGLRGKSFQTKPGPYVHLTVKDTGNGMDAETLGRVFEPFFTTKGLSRGTGLGLASVYGIVTGHGGHIEAESQIGHGTAFHIYIPATTDTPVTEQVEGSREALARGHETILLVDDEAVVLHVGEQMLRQLGYDVLLAAGGRQAVEVFRAKRDAIAMVVLDMIMPEMGGAQTFEQLKAIAPDVLVLLSSGYSAEGQAAGILERGCAGFIQKPFAIHEFSRQVRRVLDQV